MPNLKSKTKMGHDEFVHECDEYSMFGARPYIYRKGKRWFIKWWLSDEKAKAHCLDGWMVKEYNGDPYDDED